MAKRRKTRRQKIIADLRQQSIATSGESVPSKQDIQPTPLSASYTFSQLSTSKNLKPKITPIATTQQSHYAYVKKDLIKTVTVTSCILVIQVAIFLISR